MTRNTIRLAIAGACLLAVSATACSSDDDNGSAATGGPVATSGVETGDSTAAAAGGEMTISGNAFSPLSTTAGTEFTITNNDGVGHTVTADDDSFDVSVPANGTATLTIPTAGTFAIHCKIHSSMHGTITVA